MQKVKGILNVNIFLDCPSCDEQLDLMTDINYANDDGQMWELIKRSNSVGAWENINDEMNCPHCRKDFIFDSMEY